MVGAEHAKYHLQQRQILRVISNGSVLFATLSGRHRMPRESPGRTRSAGIAVP